MVVRTRVRAILFPLALYAMSASVGSYFVWHALNGERGLKAKVAYKERMGVLSAELEGLHKERAGWERRVAMMQADTVDRDLLEEEARNILGRASKNDVVILLPPRN